MSKKLVVAIPHNGKTARITVPAGVLPTATAYLWGGGGGGGGDDSPGVGGSGAAGQGYKVTFPIQAGDVLDLAPGGGGGFGSSNSAASILTRTRIVLPDGDWRDVTNYAWGSFMNAYAIWTGPANEVGTKSFSTDFYSQGGTHTIEIAADNSTIVGIGPYTGLRAAGNFRGSSGVVVSNNLPAGVHSISVQVTNDSGGGNNPGGVAITLKNSGGTIVWSTRLWASGAYSYSTSEFVGSRQGGVAGLGYVATSGDRFGGGTGGVAGPAGYSGAGGGGGGASVIAKNDVVIAVAAGGGGGGGGGNRNTVNGDSAVAQPTSDSVATVGQNGEDRTGDGGGAGGGGGGRFGGVGGTCRPGYDEGGGAGGSGTSYRKVGAETTSGEGVIGSGTTPPAIDGYSVGPAYASGGTRRVHGKDGYIIIEFQLYALPYTNVGGTWYPTRRAYVNINSNWKEISVGYIKINGQWRTLAQGQVITPNELGAGTRFGYGGTRAR